MCVCFNLPTILPKYTQLDDSEYLENKQHHAKTATAADSPADTDLIGIHKATFSWHPIDADDVCNTAKEDQEGGMFCLRVDATLELKPGAVSLTVGPAASGKTSLLMALLRMLHVNLAVQVRLANRFLKEMYCSLHDEASWCYIPREACIACAACATQETWVLNETNRVSLSALHSYLLIQR